MLELDLRLQTGKCFEVDASLQVVIYIQKCSLHLITFYIGTNELGLL